MSSLKRGSDTIASPWARLIGRIETAPGGEVYFCCPAWLPTPIGNLQYTAPTDPSEAPAFYGGFTVAYADGGRFRAAPAAVDPRVTTVVFIPPDALETTVARGLLPATVSHEDAARNAGRAALLVTALGSRPELLLAATEDRLHQDYREPAMPRSLELVRDLRAAGLPAVVSGAGPTVLAFTDATDQDEVARLVPDGWRALTLSVERTGAEVVQG